ncbi:MAG: sugar phosphate nucleotidyltransferase, partial [Solirubrobacterales bacterium]
LGLKEVDDPGPYGLVELGPEGEVLGFSEKPEDPSALPPPPWLVNAGTYVLTRSVIEDLPPGEALSIERDVFPRLAGDGMYGLGLEGYWMDIGTPERYLRATWDVLEGRIETSVPVQTDGVLAVEGSEVSPTATVGPRAVVGEGCSVAEGADVRGSVLLSGAAIGSKASVIDSILGADVVVSEGELVEGEVRGQAPVVQNRGRDAR